MKKTLLLLFFCYSLVIVAQVTNEGQPASWLLKTEPNVRAISLTKVDIKKIKSEDDINDKVRTKPYRIGIPHKVNHGLDNAGTWSQLPNGDRIWRILFNSQDAVHLSVIFDKFFLPKGGKIYLYNNDRTDLLGAYTDTQNNLKQVLGTWFVNGDKLWIEYFEPKNVKGQGKLNIASVIHGYRLGHTYQKGYLNDFQKGLNDSGDCNHDVDCPIGADFESEKNLLKKSVAFLSMGNGFICSGGLVNNTAEDKTPYFLTANHCFTDPEGIDSDPALYSMRFNWISPNPVCAAITNSTNSPTNFTISGSTLRARNQNSDFMLVQINSAIPANWDITYAGWDKSDTDPTLGVGIHHPQGDIMKICRDDTGAVKSPNGNPTAQTWEITGGAGNGWELGVTEGGSSGSPLFDQNGRVIGQLFGGAAKCEDPPNTTVDNDAFDYYGRFGVSWDGSTAATRLRDWLDPSATNPDTIDALENVLAINDETLERNITLFPNPTSGAIQIKIKEWISDFEYEIYNTLGQVLRLNKLQNNEIIDLGNLPSDVYFIKITEIDTNRSVVKKIVLAK
ncbi:MAG: T9SS type A sorting domain-containing protein [Flavobacteriaceae bacterium]|nr:T9SS type A sorting domain-containing protein [Flavobacteriaceae bacterium]